MTTPTMEEPPITGEDDNLRTVTIPAPPKRGRGRPPGSTNRAKQNDSTTTADAPKPRTMPKMPTQRGKKDYRTPIEGTLILIGEVVGQMANPTDGAIIKQFAPDVAEGWNKLAQENPSVAKVLDSITGSSAWGAALMPTILMGMALASNHNMLGAMGTRLGGMMGTGAVPSEDATASDHLPG